jgi:hypothetical protein
VWQRLRRWYCSRFGHRRVVVLGMAQCTRCGNTRKLWPRPGDVTSLFEEYRDTVDPDPWL